MSITVPPTCAPKSSCPDIIMSFIRVLPMKQDPNLLPRSKPDKQVSEEVDPGKGHYENLQASSPSTRLNNPQRVGWDGG